MMIVGLSAMNGFQSELEHRVLSVIPHGEIEGIHGSIKDWKSIEFRANQQPQVQVASPYICFRGLLERKEKVKAIEVRSVYASRERAIPEIYQFITKSRWKYLVPHNKSIILGEALASKLGVTEGSYLTLTVPQENMSQQIQLLKRFRLKVVGLLSIGGQIDHNLALIPLLDAQRYTQLYSKMTGIEIRVDNAFDISSAFQWIRKGQLKENVYFKNWQQRYLCLYQDIKMVKTILLLVMTLLVSIASFNVFSTLVIVVKGRSLEIAILRTMGATKALIRKTVIWQGIISGISGVILGILLGWLIAANLTPIFKLIEKLVGHQLLSSNIYFIDFIPSEVHIFDVVIVSVTTLLLSAIVAIRPAVEASKASPSKVLSRK